MIIRKLRLKKNWSQEHLSQISGLSSRTIQRIERGETASLESLKSLASVFEIDVNKLQQELNMNNNNQNQISEDEREAFAYVKGIKEFYTHLLIFCIVIAASFIVNYVTTPSYIWAWWAVLGWGFAIVMHALTAFEFFNLLSPEWERKQVEKRLGRKL